MADFQWLTLFFSACGLLLIPAMVVLIRGAVKWAHMESRVAELTRAQQETAAELKELTAAVRQDNRDNRGR